MKKKTLTNEEFESILRRFFKKHKGLFRNDYGTEFMFSVKEIFPNISTSAVLQKDNGSVQNVTIEITTEHYNIIEFINDYYIDDINGLKKISGDDLLPLYILNKAY